MEDEEWSEKFPLRNNKLRKILEWLECRAHNLLSSWNHTAGVHSEKLILEQSKYNIPGVHSEKLKNMLIVELQL